MDTAPLILLAAGGTGGHLFPAEALGVELIRRGFRVRLATDDRALRYSGLFTKDLIDVVPSETVRGRSPWSLARTGAMLAAGTAVALLIALRGEVREVLGQMDAILTRQGVHRIGRPGEPFDPTHHDAVAVRESEEAPDRTVVDVVRSGFALGDRVLRPAQVVVSRRPECEA